MLKFGSTKTLREPRKKAGLSLLEVLFTIGLLTIVLVAFAAVYPSGFRLNRKSARATVAAETAAAVAAEIQGLPFFDERVIKDPPISTLTDLDTSTGDRTGITKYLTTSLRTAIPTGFTIRPEGVNVNRIIDTANTAAPYFAQIAVTIYWTDANDYNRERNVTIEVGKTDNRDGR